MPIPDVADEVWSLVFQFATPSLFPPPDIYCPPSELINKTAEEEDVLWVEPTSLLACIRVSHRFYDLASPFLHQFLSIRSLQGLESVFKLLGILDPGASPRLDIGRRVQILEISHQVYLDPEDCITPFDLSSILVLLPNLVSFRQTELMRGVGPGVASHLGKMDVRNVNYPSFSTLRDLGTLPSSHHRITSILGLAISDENQPIAEIALRSLANQLLYLSIYDERHQEHPGAPRGDRRTIVPEAAVVTFPLLHTLKLASGGGPPDAEAWGGFDLFQRWNLPSLRRFHTNFLWINEETFDGDAQLPTRAFFDRNGRGLESLSFKSEDTSGFLMMLAGLQKMNGLQYLSSTPFVIKPKGDAVGQGMMDFTTSATWRSLRFVKMKHPLFCTSPDYVYNSMYHGGIGKEVMPSLEVVVRERGMDWSDNLTELKGEKIETWAKNLVEKGVKLETRDLWT